jgi:hypothetical protein
MDLDVLVNSCARPDTLEVSMRTFRKHIKTSHKLRYVLLEDWIDEDRDRRQKGRKWLTKHQSWFDEIHYAKKRMGPGFFFAPTVKLCQTDFFFHLEDDNEFMFDINIDPLIKVMQNHDDITNIVLRRAKVDKRNHPKNVVIDGLKLTAFDLFSVATGVFNTKVVKRVIDECGWDRQLREAKVLGPAAKKLGFKQYTLGFDENKPHYKHVGPQKGYRKGRWIKDRSFKKV